MPSTQPTPTRRHVLAGLAAGTLAAVAGCVEPDGVLDMDPADDAELAERATDSIRPDDADRVPVMEALAADGETTVEGERPPIGSTRRGIERPIRFDGVVYGLELEQVDERERTVYRFRLSVSDEPADIDLEELPAVDRRLLEEPMVDLARHAAATDEEPDRLELERFYDDDEREASALVPDGGPTHVAVREDAVVRVGVSETTATVGSFRYTATELAGTLAAYGERIRAEYGFELDELEEAERAVVEEAIESTYFADGTDDAAFESVARRLLDHPPVYADGNRAEFVVGYADETHWTSLHPMRYGDLREEIPDTR